MYIVLLIMALSHVPGTCSKAAPGQLQGACDQEAGASVSMLQTHARERLKQRRRSRGLPAVVHRLDQQVSNATLGQNNATGADQPAMPESTVVVSQRVPQANQTHQATSVPHGHVGLLLLQAFDRIHRRPLALLQTAVRGGEGVSTLLFFSLAVITLVTCLCLRVQRIDEVRLKRFEDRLAAPLCRELVVQGGMPLVCQIESRFWCERQHLSFDIYDSSGTLLATARAREVHDSPPCIQLEPPGGGEAVACVLTEELYRSHNMNPVLSIFQGPPPPAEAPAASPVSSRLQPGTAWAPGWGAPPLRMPRFVNEAAGLVASSAPRQSWSPGREEYAVLKRTRRNEFKLLRMGRDVLIFEATKVGGFHDHTVNVYSARGPKVARAEPLGGGGEEDGDGRGVGVVREAYQVTIEPNVDAALVLLGFLTIDKCERPPQPPEPRRCPPCYPAILANRYAATSGLGNRETDRTVTAGDLAYASDLM